ncbi:MAG: hypothetical protein ACRD12_06530 [Acidimicrobiales bacterium]
MSLVRRHRAALAAASLAIVVAGVAVPAWAQQSTGLPVQFAGVQACFDDGSHYGRYSGPAGEVRFYTYSTGVLSVATHWPDVYVGDTGWVWKIAGDPPMIQSIIGAPGDGEDPSAPGRNTPQGPSKYIAGLTVEPGSGTPVYIDMKNGLELWRHGSPMPFKDSSDRDQSAIRGMAVIGDYVYYTKPSGQVLKVSLSSLAGGAPTNSTVVATGIQGPRSLAVGPPPAPMTGASGLYLAGNAPQVVWLDTATGATTPVGPTLAANTIKAVAVDPVNQQLFITEYRDLKLTMYQIDLERSPNVHPIVLRDYAVSARSLAYLPSGNGPGKVLLATNNNHCGIEAFTPVAREPLPEEEQHDDDKTVVDDETNPGGQTGTGVKVEPFVVTGGESSATNSAAAGSSPAPGGGSATEAVAAGAGPLSGGGGGGEQAVGVQPPAGPPPPNPGGSPQLAGLAPIGGGGPPHGQVGWAGVPSEAATGAPRYAMVRHDNGPGRVVGGLLAGGLCMVLLAIGLGVKGRRPGVAAEVARAWARGS